MTYLEFPLIRFFVYHYDDGLVNCKKVGMGVFSLFSFKRHVLYDVTTVPNT